MKRLKTFSVSSKDDQNALNSSKAQGFRDFFRTMKLKEVARKFKILASATRYKYLRQIHFSLINDNSIIYKSNSHFKEKRSDDVFTNSTEQQANQEQYKKEKNPLQKFLAKYLEKIPVFTPSHVLKDIWDIFQIISYLILFFYIPIHVTFTIEFKNLLSLPFCYGLAGQICLDILVNLNTGYYDKGVAVKSRKQVTAHYCKTYLLKDCISIVPFVLYFVLFKYFDAYKSYYPNAILLLFFMRLSKFKEIMHRIEENFHMKPSTRNLINLFKVLLNIVFASHIFSCLWIVMAIEEQKSFHYEVTWFTPLKIEDADWFIKYLYAYYFSSVTMITVGYGDVLPKTSPELVLCIITMIIACGLFGYSLNQIGVIVQDVFKTETVIKENLYVITNYMNTKSINSDLQFQIRQYLEYYLKEQSQNNTEMETKIINQLSDVLKDSLKQESNKLVINSPIFNNFSEEIRQKMVPLIKQKRSNPEELIYSLDIIDDNCIYFIEKGTIDEIIDMNEQKNDQNGVNNKIKAIKTYEDGESFGELNFFTGTARRQTTRSRQFSKLMYIRREDFLNLLKDHKEDYEIFCCLRDRLLMNNELDVIGMKCQSCYGYHSLDDCQWVHYAPDKFKVLQRHCISLPQHRKQYRRRRKLKFNSLFQNDYIKRKIASYCENNIKQILEIDWYIDMMNKSDLTNNSDDDQQKKQSSSDDENGSKVSLDKNKFILNEESDDDSETCSIVKKSKQKSDSDLFQLDDIGKERQSATNLTHKVQLKKDYNKNSKNWLQLDQYEMSKHNKIHLTRQSSNSPKSSSKNIVSSNTLKVNHGGEVKRTSLYKGPKNNTEQLQGHQNFEDYIKYDQIKPEKSSILIPHQYQRNLLSPNSFPPQNVIIEQLLNILQNHTKKPNNQQPMNQNLISGQHSNNIQGNKQIQNSDPKQINNAIQYLYNLLQGMSSPHQTQNLNVRRSHLQHLYGDQQGEYDTDINDMIFDTLQSYKHYFPYGNFESVIESIEKIPLYQKSMKKILNTAHKIPEDDNNQIYENNISGLSKQNKRDLFYQNVDSFSKRYTSSAITPSYMIRKIMHQKTTFIRHGEGNGHRNSKLGISQFTAKPKAFNSKIQNLIDKFKIEEESNPEQASQDKSKISISNEQQEKIEKRKRQILKKCTVIQHSPQFKKSISQSPFAQSPQASFSQFNHRKKLSDFKYTVNALENSSSIDQIIQKSPDFKESLTSEITQGNEDDVLFISSLKQSQAKSPLSISKNVDFSSNFDGENVQEYVQVKKKSLFNQPEKKVLINANQLSESTESKEL